MKKNNLFLLVIISLCFSDEEGPIATAEDIIKHAEKILICEAIGTKSDSVMFKVIETVKGYSNKDTIFYKGYIDNYRGRGKALVDYPGPPYNRVRGDGDPYAYDYELGKQFLLFICFDTPYWSRFAATNEEVTGSDDLWVILVKGFLEEGPSIYAKLGLERPDTSKSEIVDLIIQLKKLEEEEGQ